MPNEKELTGPACTEALNGAEEARRRERAEGNAGGVRVEREVRHPKKLNLTRVDGKPGFERTTGMPMGSREMMNLATPKTKN